MDNCIFYLIWKVWTMLRRREFHLMIRAQQRDVIWLSGSVIKIRSLIRFFYWVESGNLLLSISVICNRALSYFNFFLRFTKLIVSILSVKFFYGTCEMNVNCEIQGSATLGDDMRCQVLLHMCRKLFMHGYDLHELLLIQCENHDLWVRS